MTEAQAVSDISCFVILQNYDAKFTWRYSSTQALQTFQLVFLFTRIAIFV